MVWMVLWLAMGLIVVASTVQLLLQLLPMSRASKGLRGILQQHPAKDPP